MEQALASYFAGRHYHIYQYGCMMNEHEAEAAAGILEEIGCIYHEDVQEADIVFFNTCSICHEIEQRALERITRQEHKFVIVCGCMAQKNAQELAQLAPNCRVIFGTGKMHLLKKYLYDAIVNQGKVVCKAGPAVPREDLPVLRSSDVKAYVSIMNGCSNYCAYCIVPFVRGRAVCRSTQDILREIRRLVKDGYQEITLLGQNVLQYQKDGIGFRELLLRAAETGIARLRFYTSNPRDLDERLLRVIAKTPNICKNLHLPVQSGSNEVLAAMRRGYTREQYIELALCFRELMPEGSLTSDFIVGFPGETEAQYQETEALYRLLQFDDAYLFAFSPREGTQAAELEAQVSIAERQERLRRLETIKWEVRQRRADALRATVQPVLVEECSRGKLLCRMDNGWYVSVPDNGIAAAGDFVNVMVTETTLARLSGKLL